jgi:rhodanese-related sulfurtransferase
VDSRPRSRYLQAHLPSAVSIPEDVLKEKGAAAVLPQDKATRLVFYCGGVTCGLSTSSAKLAKEAGYSNVSVYQAGEPEWTKSGRPTYAAPAFITDGNVILIDLRDPAVAVQGAIAGAVSIPAATLEAASEELQVRAPLVLYGADEAQALAARTLLLAAEFKKVSLVEGGYDLWKSAGRPVTTGPLPTSVTWKRKPVPGEIDLASFQAAVTGDRTGLVLLDVRGPAEIAAGTVPGSLNIPLDQLAKRIGEVPRGGKIYVFCNSGARAEMAVKALVKAGHEARFLVADIACENGACTFSE